MEIIYLENISSGAAFSSILTCPLAASLTADSVLNFKQIKSDSDEKDSEVVESDKNSRDMPRKYFISLIFIMILVSAVVISFNGESGKILGISSAE